MSFLNCCLLLRGGDWLTDCKRPNHFLCGSMQWTSESRSFWFAGGVDQQKKKGERWNVFDPKRSARWRGEERKGRRKRRKEGRKERPEKSSEWDEEAMPVRIFSLAIGNHSSRLCRMNWSRRLSSTMSRLLNTRKQKWKLLLFSRIQPLITLWTEQKLILFSPFASRLLFPITAPSRETHPQSQSYPVQTTTQHNTAEL